MERPASAARVPPRVSALSSPLGLPVPRVTSAARLAAVAPQGAVGASTSAFANILAAGPTGSPAGPQPVVGSGGVRLSVSLSQPGDDTATAGARRPTMTRTLRSPRPPRQGRVPLHGLCNAVGGRPRRAHSAPRAGVGAPSPLWLAVGQRVLTLSGDPVRVNAVPPPAAAPRVFDVQHPDGTVTTCPGEALRLPPASRVWCPVPGCPCGDARRHRGYASIGAMRAHLNWHCANPGNGRVPHEWLRDHDRVLCPQCGFVITSRMQCCERCWPRRRAEVPGPCGQVGAAPCALPDLDAVLGDDIPTLKHVPQAARAAWGRALRGALGSVEAEQSVARVTELLMLAKCVLCIPPSGRTGRQHRNRTASFTVARLARWERGDRMALWADATRAGRRARRARDGEAAAAFRAERAEELAREGLWSKAAAALLDVGVAEANATSRAEMERLHPAPLEDCADFDLAGAAPPPEVSPAAVVAHLRSFARGTAPGPSGLRAQHFLDALAAGNEEAL
eukprot:gene12589-11789_t